MKTTRYDKHGNKLEYGDAIRRRNPLFYGGKLHKNGWTYKIYTKGTRIVEGFERVEAGVKGSNFKTIRVDEFQSPECWDDIL